MLSRKVLKSHKKVLKRDAKRRSRNYDDLAPEGGFPVGDVADWMCGCGDADDAT